MVYFPVLRLGNLILRTVSKPLSNRIKIEAKRSEKVTNFFVSVGEGVNQLTKRANIMVYGYKVLNVEKLSFEDAYNKGVDISSELFVFSVTVSIVVYEYNRAEEGKRQAVEAAKQNEIDHLKWLADKFQSIDERLARLENKADELALKSNKTQDNTYWNRLRSLFK